MDRPREPGDDDVPPVGGTPPVSAGPSTGLRPLLALRGCLFGVLLVTVLGIVSVATVSLLARGFGVEIVGLDTLLSLIASGAGFLVAAALTLLTARLRVVDTLSFVKPSAGAVIAAVLLGCGAMLFNASLTARLYPYFDTGYLEVLARMVVDLRQLVTPAGVLLLIGILVPFCEEVLFRGVILQALLARWSAPASVAVSSLIFAAFHLHPVHALVALILGSLAALTVVVSRSLWPAVIVHAVNNSFVAVPALSERLDSFLPLWLLVPAIGLIGAGLVLLVRSGARRPS